MQKIKLCALLMAALLTLPTLLACKQTADQPAATNTEQTTPSTQKVVADYPTPDTKVEPSPDGSTGIVYAFSIENAGEFEGEHGQIVGGGTSTPVTAIPGVGYRFVRWSDGLESPTRSGDQGQTGKLITLYAIVAPIYLEMPVMHITTETGFDVESKYDYIGGSVTLTNCGEAYALEEASIQIRGRGNFSWGLEKKSYRIRLDEKENLLGIGDAKGRHWNLLANHCDQSLLRNYTALTFAGQMSGIGYSPACKSVEVYLNGAYHGVFLLCEAIRVGKGRVDIQDDPEAGTDIGYLLQMTRYAEEPMFYVDDRAFEIKSDLSADEELAWEQSMFIQDYVTRCFEAVQTGDRETIEELMDINSVLDTYIVEETVKNLDVGWDSFYLYKDSGGKLCLGPIWDFDLALGNANEGCDTFIDLYAAQNAKSQSNPWFYYLMGYQWFRDLLTERWKSAEVQKIVGDLPEMIRQQAEAEGQSYARNFERWQIFGQRINREPRAIMSLQTYPQHAEYLEQWLTGRIAWMNEFIGGDRYQEGYNTDSGGNSGIVTPPVPTEKFECSGGRGTYNDPYLISTVKDFVSFTNALYAGDSFGGKYLLQTADLDLTQANNYRGIGSAGNFAGIYNGGGHILHAELTGSDECIFPYLSGVVLNLGTTGSIRNSGQAAGICRSIRQGGALINCYSLMDVSSDAGDLVGGLSASTQAGNNLMIANCYFGGTLGGEGAAATNAWKDGRGGTFAFLYSCVDVGATNLAPADIQLPANQMNGHLADLLNQNLDQLFDLEGEYSLTGKISSKDLLHWSAGQSYPIHQGNESHS